MLEDAVINCPFCDTVLHVKVFSSKKPTYIVDQDCPNCKVSSGKIERKMNSSGKTYTSVEKSYIKTDPRG